MARRRRRGVPSVGGRDALAGRLAELRREVRRARAEAIARERRTEPGPAGGSRSGRRFFIAGGAVAVVAAGVVAGLLASSSGGRHPRAGPSPSSTPPSSGPATAPPSTVPPSTVPASTVPASPGPSATTAAPPPPLSPVSPPAASTVTVAPGESFWSIAEQIVGGRLGRMPTSAEVARYWTALIAANSSRLPIPAQPNLLYTGTLVVLPPSA